MSKYDYIIGKRFGRLVVEEIVGKDKWKNITCRCKCDCGKVIITRCISLVKKHVISCKCYTRDRMSKFNKNKYGLSSKKYIYYDYKSKSKKKGRIFELSFEEFVVLAQQNCFYCGSKPGNVKKSEHNNGDFVYNGIDRKDNTKGYTIENCVPCCKTCNGAKSKMSYKDFMLWIKNLVYYQNLIRMDNGG